MRRSTSMPARPAPTIASCDARPGAEETLLAALSRYVVMTRHEPECRNVDLVASVTRPGRFQRKPASA